MKTLRQCAGILIAGVLLFYLIKPFVLTHTQLKDVTFQVRWIWLIPSFGMMLFYRSLYIYPFAALLNGVAQKQVSFRTAFTLFHLANITRYLPGRIWGVVRLLSLSQQFGLSKTATGGSLTLHVGIETVLGGLFAMSLVFSTQIRGTIQIVLEKVSGHAVLLIIAIIGFVVGVAFIIPFLSTHAHRFLRTLRQTGEPLLQKSFSRQWVAIPTGHILLWICQGLAFFLFVKSFTPVGWEHAGILAACYAFAWIIGFLSFLTPGGLGIREGLLVVLLSNYMPASQATLVSLLCRVWMLSAECVLAGVAFSLRRQNTGVTLFIGGSGHSNHTLKCGLEVNSNEKRNYSNNL